MQQGQPDPLFLIKNKKIISNIRLGDVIKIKNKSSKKKLNTLEHHLIIENYKKSKGKSHCVKA